MERSAQAWGLLQGGRFRDSLIPFASAAQEFRLAAEARAARALITGTGQPPAR